MKDTRVRELIFIFDADSGKLGVLKDSLKKVLHLKGCPLCSITHSLSGEKKEMTECRMALGVSVDYKHRDELSEAMRAACGVKIPSVLARTDAGYQLILEPEVLERCAGNVSSLRGKLMFHLGAHHLTLGDAPLM